MRICGDLKETPFLRQNHRNYEMQLQSAPSIQTSTSRTRLYPYMQELSVEHPKSCFFSADKGLR
jgi:hypothetical protein